MNERTNLKEVTEYINRLLEEVINTNDFQSFDETLAVIASHSTITDTNNQVEFERFLLDLVVSIERSTELNWFEKSGFFSVLLKNLKSCSEEALAIAKIYMVDHLVAPEHNCSTLQKKSLMIIYWKTPMTSCLKELIILTYCILQFMVSTRNSQTLLFVQ